MSTARDDAATVIDDDKRKSPTKHGDAVITSTDDANSSVELGHGAGTVGGDRQRDTAHGRFADDAAFATDALLKDDDHARHLRSGTRKLDWTVVPPLLLMWLANFVDRSNAGNARIAGMETDLKLIGRQFNISLAVFYVSYILVEIPSNLVLKKVGGNLWLPFITFAWGLVTACTAAAHNFAGFVAIRFVLGACEGGLLGGITLYLSGIYPRFRIQQRIARFYAAASIAGAFGGLLAAGLTTLNTNNIRGWRWLYIVEGVITCGFAIFAACLMPRSVATSRYLNEDERRACLAALQTDIGVSGYTYRPDVDNKHAATEPKSDGSESQQQRERDSAHIEEQFEWYEVRRGMFDIQTWLTGILYLCVCTSLYSLTLFLPTILIGIFPDAAQTRIQLLTVPPFACAAALVLVVAYLSDKWKTRGPFILAFLPIAIIGYIILVATKDNRARYAAVFLICLGVYPPIPSILTLIANNSAGHYKRAAATAMQLMIANLAGFIATFIYDNEFRQAGFVTPHAVVLGCLCLGWICIAINVAVCYRENAARAAGKRDGNIAAYEELVRRGVTRAPIGDRHPGFRFSL